MRKFILFLILVLITSVAFAENNIFEGTLDEALVAEEESKAKTIVQEETTVETPVATGGMFGNLIPDFINQISNQLELKSMNINDGVTEIVFKTTPDKIAEVSALFDWKQTNRLEYDQNEGLLRFVFGNISSLKTNISTEKKDEIESTIAAETSRNEDEYTICPDCINGHCIECDGRGVVDCDICFGMRICTVCFGKRQSYVPGYGGVGTGSYVTCKGCNGSGRCSFCNGTGTKDCIFCDGGVCPTCKGDYMHYKKR